MSKENKTITEIVTFTVSENYSEGDVKEIVERLVTGFLTTFEGYGDTELVKGKEENQWIMILHWDSQEAVDAIGARFSTAHETEEYRNSLTNVSLHFTPQIGNWRAA